eukprot:jgi/Psemu1/8005/gm1.8005_g
MVNNKNNKTGQPADSPDIGTATRTTRGFQGQDRVNMKGIVIVHNIDHKVPTIISQQLNVFYKAVKIVAGKIKPGPLKTSSYSHWPHRHTDYTVNFPDASEWTTDEMVDTHKKEMYSQLWLEEKMERRKDKKKYEEDLKKLFAIMYGQLSSGITEKLRAKTDWKTIVDESNALKLLEDLKEVCYRYNDSSVCPAVDVLLKIKKFIDAVQDASKDPNRYVEEVQLRFEVMKQGSSDNNRIGCSHEIHHAACVPEPSILNLRWNDRCREETNQKEAVQEMLLSLIIEGFNNKKNHRNLPAEINNNRTRTKLSQF